MGAIPAHDFENSVKTSRETPHARPRPESDWSQLLYARLDLGTFDPLIHSCVLQEARHSQDAGSETAAEDVDGVIWPSRDETTASGLKVKVDVCQEPDVGRLVNDAKNWTE